MIMKVHAYLREKVLYGRKNDYATWVPPYLSHVKLDALSIPTITVESFDVEISRYLYFSFAPTLIYRDSYPRLARGMKPWRVFGLWLNACGSFLYLLVIFSTYCIPYFKDSWATHFDLANVVMALFNSMLPGTMVLILAFFGVNHTWFNLWAELLGFGDRMFYDDWWNATSFAEYYRKWNCTVHDWIYYYVYQDIIRFSKNTVGKGFAYLITFLSTFIVYEWFVSISFRFFYPILFLTFGGPAIFFMKATERSNRVMSLLFWMAILLGNGAIMMFFSWEFYSR
jgi:sterol O-acyltransferase